MAPDIIRKYPKLLKSAKGKMCTLRLFPFCNQNTETTVPCHIPSGSGGSQKSPDWFMVYGCSRCHDVIDGRVQQNVISEIEIQKSIVRALYETWLIMISEGIIKC